MLSPPQKSDYLHFELTEDNYFLYWKVSQREIGWLAHVSSIVDFHHDYLG